MDNVIVTGASRGLGLAIAVALAEAGYRVIGVARTRSDGFEQALAAAQRSGRGALTFQPFDLANTHELSGLVATLRREHGPIFGLINNAGIGTAGVLANMREEQIEALVRLNTLSPILLTRHVIRSMMSQRRGRVVNVASVIAATGYSGLSVYAATKGSLVGFTRSLAREVGELGITVNAIAPGFIETEMTSSMQAESLEKIRRRSALRRLADPQDVAAAAVFLLGESGRNITGITLTVDAGSTA
jgi:3-oxoacyl-[acyl-carrier protein] reductase